MHLGGFQEVMHNAALNISALRNYFNLTVTNRIHFIPELNKAVLLLQVLPESLNNSSLPGFAISGMAKDCQFIRSRLSNYNHTQICMYMLFILGYSYDNKKVGKSDLMYTLKLEACHIDYEL